MNLIDIASMFPVEILGVAFGGSATAVASVIAFTKKIKDQIKLEREAILKAESERRKEFISSLSGVMARTVNNEIDHALEARHYTRAEQILRARNALEIYGNAIIGTSADAVKNIIEQSHEAFDTVKSLYMDAVMNSFLVDVHQYFIRVISKNGFLEKTDSQFREWCRSVLSVEAFGVFLASMRRRFDHESIRDRVLWIESNIDRVAIADMVERFMWDCRELSRDYYQKRKCHSEHLAIRIENDIIATQGKK